jgi:hypothetical protein
MPREQRSGKFQIPSKETERNPNHKMGPIPIHCVPRFAALFGVLDIRDAAEVKERHNDQTQRKHEIRIPKHETNHNLEI